MKWPTLTFALVVVFSTLCLADTLTDSQVRQISDAPTALQTASKSEGLIGKHML